MAIGGQIREPLEGNFTRKVGLFEAKVIAINPTTEEFKSVLGFNVKDDSKEMEYVSENENGNTKVRIDVWLEAVKTGDKMKASFYLEDEDRVSEKSSNNQYINNQGVCSWPNDQGELPDWFKKTEHRVARVGEDSLYKFLRAWLNKLDYKNAETVLDIEWKKLMKGNVKLLRNEIDGEYCGTFIALATIKTKEVDGEIREYQTVYNKDFLPHYFLKNFRLVDYNDEKQISALRAKKKRDRKPYEEFVVEINSDYGCKDFFLLTDLKDYDPKENNVSSDRVIKEEDSSY